MSDERPPAGPPPEFVFLVPDRSTGSAQPAGDDGPWDRTPQAHRPTSGARPPGGWQMPLILFVATCLSTMLAGGLAYAAALMSILVAHEAGHYLVARWYRIPATLPLFIPMPYSPIGTFGAVIVQAARLANRRETFDIGIAGPLAGLGVALPVLWWGLGQSQVLQIPKDQVVVSFGEPLLVQWMIQARFGEVPAGHDVMLHPVGFAGWVGVFITGLNLLPIGQLDGGHTLYTLWPRQAHQIALGVWWVGLACVLGFGFTGNPGLLGWVPMLLILGLMGILHPPTADDDQPLGAWRTLLGWLTLSFVVIGFTPTPMTIHQP